MGVRANGDVLVVDVTVVDDVAEDDNLSSVDVTNTDVRQNETEISGGNQYGQLADVSVDANDVIYVMDYGACDGTSCTCTVLPRILRVDESIADAQANAVVVSEPPIAYISPLSLEVVPGFRLDSVTPTRVGARPADCAATPLDVTLQGEGFLPGLSYDLGPSVPIVGAGASSGGAPTPSISLDVLPTPPTFGGVVNVRVSHPFGETETLLSAISFQGGTYATSHAPPCSQRGDASCDAGVDGIDRSGLATLAAFFGATF